MNNSKYNGLMLITVSSWTQFAFFFWDEFSGLYYLGFVIAECILKGFLVGSMLSLSVYS